MLTVQGRNGPQVLRSDIVALVKYINPAGIPRGCYLAWALEWARQVLASL